MSTMGVRVLAAALLLYVGADFANPLMPGAVTFDAGDRLMEHELTARVALFVLQLAVVLLAAKLAGEVATRVGQPAILGELLAGVAIGPHALGALDVPGLGSLFPAAEGPVPILPELYAISQLGAVILLFSAGLETDLRLFLKS